MSILKSSQLFSPCLVLQSVLTCFLILPSFWARPSPCYPQDAQPSGHICRCYPVPVIPLFCVLNLV
jgi:hypothetical protein